MNIRLLQFLALILALTLWACIFFPEEKTSQGGGSDTETLSGTVTLGDGATATRTLIKLVPTNYNPSKPDTSLVRKTVTDDSGHFNFAKLMPGTYYNLIAGKSDEHAWAYADSLKADGGHLTLSLSPAKVVFISLEYAGYAKKDSGLAYFPGTDILTHCNGVDASRIDSLPVGVSHIVVESRAGWAHDTTLVNLKDSADVKADQNGIIWIQ